MQENIIKKAEFIKYITENLQNKQSITYDSIDYPYRIIIVDFLNDIQSITIPDIAQAYSSVINLLKTNTVYANDATQLEQDGKKMRNEFVYPHLHGGRQTSKERYTRRRSKKSKRSTKRR
jgi:hypothetical protein